MLYFETPINCRWRMGGGCRKIRLSRLGIRGCSVWVTKPRAGQHLSLTCRKMSQKWWHHVMEMLSVLLSLVMGIRSFHSKNQQCGASVFSCYGPKETIEQTNLVYYAGVILGMGSANERRCYTVITYFIGWAYTTMDSATEMKHPLICQNACNFPGK